LRRPIGIAAFVLALAVLALLVFALRQGVTIHLPQISTWRRIALGASGPIHHGSGSHQAQGIQEVVVQVPSVGDVQVSTSPGSRISWNWSAAGSTSSVMQVGDAGGVLTLTYTPQAPLELNFNSMPDVLQVQMPPGLNAELTVATGGATISGTYRAVSADVTTGALSVRDFAGQLTGNVVTGPLNAQAVTAKGPLKLRVGTGPLNFSGDPGLESSFTVGTGPLSLRIAPHGRLQVQSAAHLGPMSSGFSGLPNGTNGVFDGTIGQGPAGSLAVDDGTGPVSIMPQ
jgi:hypothetical protein